MEMSDRLRRRFKACVEFRENTPQRDGTDQNTSRQFLLAAKPDAVLRFHLRHLEQTDQHAEPVAPRYPSQFGDGLGNKGRSLIRPAIPHRII